MSTKTTPVASLGALLAAITETIAASEQRVMDRLGEIENRIVGLEDKITEAGTHMDEIKDDLQDSIADLKSAVEAFDTSPISEVADTLDELADAERRRERQSWLAEVRRAS